LLGSVISAAMCLAGFCLDNRYVGRAGALQNTTCSLHEYRLADSGVACPRPAAELGSRRITASCAGRFWSAPPLCDSAAQRCVWANLNR
jgi:hypothetical protein